MRGGGGRDPILGGGGRTPQNGEKYLFLENFRAGGGGRAAPFAPSPGYGPVAPHYITTVT